MPIRRTAVSPPASETIGIPSKRLVVAEARHTSGRRYGNSTAAMPSRVIVTSCKTKASTSTLKKSSSLVTAHPRMRMLRTTVRPIA
jgi:hypothetical protein